MMKWFRSTKNEDNFSNLMSWSKVLAERKNIEGLRDLIRIVLRPVQSEHIRDAYIKEKHKGISELFWNESLGIQYIIPGIEKTLADYIWSDECLVKDKSIYPTLNLASDITLPTSWHPESIVLNLGKIGEGKPNGAFQQSSNHSVMLSYPLGIGWVENGNHSIIQGILRGEGQVIPTEVHDLSKLIELIKFDGVNWKSTVSEKNLGEPRYVEFGWVWEIGRLILKIEESPYQSAIKEQLQI